MSEGGGVVYVGPITPGNVAKWKNENVLQDGGAAGTGNVSSVPTPVAGHIALWASPTTIQDGGLPATGNVTSVPTPVAGHLAVWASPTSIQDGGVPATGNVVVVPAVTIGHIAVWAGPNAIQDGGVPVVFDQSLNTTNSVIFANLGVTGTGIISPGNIPNFYIQNNAGSPFYVMDANDYYYYDRTNNFHAWVIGSATVGYFSALGLNTPSINVTGAVAPANGMFLSGANQLGWSASGGTVMTLDATLFHVAPNAQFDAAIRLAGSTSAFPALFRSGAELHIKLADNSGFASTRAQNFIAQAAGGNFYGTFGVISGVTDGVMQISNLAGTNFSRLQLGGTTNAFPSLKRVATAVAVRLADDSADAPITASTFNGSTLGLSTKQTLATVGAGVYTTPANCRQIRIRMVGAGGGGGANSNIAQNGTSGGNSIFNGQGAAGGQPGLNNGSAGIGGAGAAVPGFRFPGNSGSPGFPIGTGGIGASGSGGSGAGSAWGGGTRPGENAPNNTGAGGGGGAGSGFTGTTGGGGGSGEYVEFEINAPLAATYAYTVGAGGIAQGGVPGTFGVGGNGGNGLILVQELY